MISTGQELNFLIETSYTLFSDWSTFALTYSLKRFLPDCSVYINRMAFSPTSYFTWIPKMGAKNSKDLGRNPFISIDSTILMLRPIEDEIAIKIKESGSVNEFCSEAKDDKFTSFISFASGCGNFVTTEWINRNDYPFLYAEVFMTTGACVNEIEIIKLWKRANQIYSFLSRGS